MSWTLEQADITLRLPVPESPFWALPEVSRYETGLTSVVSAAFVDDECFVLMAASGALPGQSYSCFAGPAFRGL
eukprot:954719-Pyramimonas_sp.AAC.1